MLEKVDCMPETNIWTDGEETRNITNEELERFEEKYAIKVFEKNKIN